MKIFIFTVVFAEMQMSALNQLLDIAYTYENYDLFEPPVTLIKEPDFSKDPDEDLQSFLDNLKVFSI